MIKEAENIILNKEYYELSADELATVSELVANADEFEDMKWFLASTQQALVSEKIEATPDLKKKVMEHLSQPKEKRRFWLNGVIPFLLPENKRFYQKPAFQMSIAALLIVGFVLINNNSFKDTSVALNDGKMIEDKVGGDKLDDLALEEDEDLSTILADEEPTPSDDNGGVFGEIRTVNPELINFESVADEEIDEIAHDGYYSGPMTDDDLKKIENSKDKDRKDLNTTGSVNVNTNGTNSGKFENTISPAVIDADDETVISGNKNNIKNNPNNPGQVGGTKKQKTDFKGKQKADKKDGRLKKTNSDAYSSTVETVDKPELEQNLAGGGFDDNNRDQNKIITEEDSKDLLNEKEYKEIRPFSAHVNETKELKKLFTVYK